MLRIANFTEKPLIIIYLSRARGIHATITEPVEVSVYEKNISPTKETLPTSGECSETTK